MMINIVIGADCVPTDTNLHFFQENDVEKLIGKELQDVFQKVDFRVLNLEAPIIDDGKTIKKNGPTLKISPYAISGLKGINPDFFTLANNHIMDYGVEGLYNTMRILEENNVQYSGVGEDLVEARKPYICDINGVKIGIYTCVENEFSIAGNRKPGANPYDPLHSFDDVKNLKQKCDFLMVLYHGGKELYRYPSPQLQRVFHKFADFGADLVIAQHTHCIGCKELYGNSMLVYGQGNFIFDDGDDNEYVNTSLVIKILIDDKTRKCKYEFLPIIKNGNTICLAKGNERKEILDAFEKRSEDILKKDFVTDKYMEFAQEMQNMYFYSLSAGYSKNVIIRILNKLSKYKLLKSFYQKKYRMSIWNYITCESHLELLQTIMKNY